MNALEQAGKLIEQGWCAAFLEKDGKYCSVGALAAVLFEPERGKMDEENDAYDFEWCNQVYEIIDETPEAKALAAEIAENNDPDWYPIRLKYPPTHLIYIWNDAQGDQQDVVNMFKSAAARLEE